MRFSIQDTSTESKLNKAVLLYSNGVGASYATIHEVHLNDRQAPVIGAGRPLDTKALKTLVRELSPSLLDKTCILPGNVLSVGSTHIMWWSPPSRRAYFFDTRIETEGVSVGKRCGEAFAPGLIFLVRDSQLWVYAVKGNKRPDADTALFHAPLMNLYADGALCTGSMAKPQSTLVESITQWENAFWDSRFTHPNHPRPVSFKGGLHAFSNALLDGQFRKFPDRVLRPMKRTLQDVVSAMDAPKTGRRTV